MRDWCQAQYGSDAVHHIFTTVDQFGAIMTFYGRVLVKKEGVWWEQLKGIENRIIQGEIDSICGIINLNQNHWVSVVIDFRQCQILYGDSFHQQMPTCQHKSYQRWVKHLINQSKNLVGEIAVGDLATGVQDDGISCGLFALNSIAHHYFEDPLLPTNSVALNFRRKEIGLNILGTMVVCLLALYVGKLYDS